MRKTICGCILLLMVLACSQSLDAAEPMILSGRITNVIKEEKGDSVVLSLALTMSFQNVSEKPILLTVSSYPKSSPYYIPDNSFMSICAKVTGMLEAAEKILYSSCSLPSIEGTSDWQNIRKEFDRKIPPQHRIKFLNPGQSFEFESRVRVSFLREQDPYSVNRENALWNEIVAAKCLVLRMTYRIWSLELEPRSGDRNDRPFGKELQKRWKDYGYLWLEDINSQPIEIQLN